MALISDKIIKELQKRIEHEEFNAKSYDAMGNWLDLNGYVNAAKLWRKYAGEERSHKQWSVDYLLDLNILPEELKADKPQIEFKGLPNIVALTMKRELETTDEVKALAKIAMDEGDFMTFGLAQKYVAEQVEEIRKVQKWIDIINQFGDSQIALKMLDKQMGEEL
jgi:ferritin